MVPFIFQLPAISGLMPGVMARSPRLSGLASDREMPFTRWRAGGQTTGDV